MLEVTFLAAFTAGVLTFLSPCILPLVPAYVGYLAGGALADDPRPPLVKALSRLGPALAFVLGFGLVFVLFGFVAAGIVKAFGAALSILQILAGNLLVIAGLHFLHLINVPLLQRAFSPDLARGRQGLAGGFLFGLAFGLGWSPCAGPILATIVTLAAMKSHTIWQSGLYLAVYALGIGVPFVVAALLIEPVMRLIRRMGNGFRAVEIFTGIALLVTGLLLQTGYLAKFAFALTEVMGVGG